MISYLLKFILTSLVLILIYYLFLEKEKIFLFNRFYLLISILFSFIVPFITIEIDSTALPVNAPAILNENILLETNTQSQVITNNLAETTNFQNVLLGIYLLISFFLLIRLIKNIRSIFYQIRTNKRISYLNVKLILRDDIQTPFSFLKFVFVNKTEFENKQLEDKILYHELTHVQQMHSFDILFLELLIIFAWINPFLFLYRRAIQMNHEFFVDQSVVLKTGDAREYQHLLVNKSNKYYNPLLLSTFNFLTIKRRIKMMNKRSAAKLAWIKKTLVIPTFIIIGFLVSFKIVAKNIDAIITESPEINIVSDSVSQQLMDEYQGIIESHKKLLKDGKLTINMNSFAPEELERMEEIFNQMSKEQKLKQSLGFIPANTMYLKKSVPTEEKFESFKDPKMYGIWIDGKRANNDILNNYKASDFSQYNISRLTKYAINYGKHVYQLGMMTNSHYENYKKEIEERKGSTLVPIGMYKSFANN